MNQLIKKDLYRYSGKKYSFALLLIFLFKVPGFSYTYFLRKANQNKKYSIRGIFYRLLHKKKGYKYGFQIPVGTKIGGGFYIGHFGNIVINPNARIGCDCNIHQGVTIGQANRGKLKGCPTLGDKVWIGPNAVIVGNIKIGNNVLIAPNAYVNFNVPDNSIVIGNPGIIKPKNNPVEGYINRTSNNY
jgi:serine O-acetyltransferase